MSKPRKRKRWSPEVYAKKEAGLKRFVLVGDICHPGRIVVEASTIDEAVKKAEDGDFTVWDESAKHLLFQWNGDPEMVEILPLEE